MSTYSDKMTRRAAAARFLDDTPLGRGVKRSLIKVMIRGLAVGLVLGAAGMWLLLRG